MTLVEKKESAEPMLERIDIKFHDGGLCLKQMERKEAAFPFFMIDTKKTSVHKKEFHINCSNLDMLYSSFHYFRYFLYGSKRGPFNTVEGKALRQFMRQDRRTFFYRKHFPEAFSFAPIRSRPKRTYDPVGEFEDSEGSHIPMLLMRLKSMKDHQWEALQNQLIQFGKASGLFDNIEVKKHGKTMSDPFQIQIKVRGPRSNIMDVGYGINQILPILVSIFNSKREKKFLLQQPEVHLHPKGQAELTSLLTQIVKDKKHSFIIETHSDYMIDRARVEIKKHNISPEDVSLIYMEPKGAHVKVHNIGFDAMGNLTDVPKSYREFFLKETDRLLGYTD